MFPTFSDNSLLLSMLSQPPSGRLCYRSLPDGDVVVGILRMPPEFVPLEGVMYILMTTPAGLAIIPKALDGGIGKHMESLGAGDLLREPIWAKTLSSEARPVRFLQAFPEENAWTVFGPSHHVPPLGTPSHRWVDIHDGVATPIDPPIDATGFALSQILTMAPVWPNATGVLHTLPQLPVAWREHYHRYSKLLAASARDPALSEALEETVAADPYFCQFTLGSIDRGYCLYLARLEDRGLLDVDRPRSAAEVAARNVVIDELVCDQATHGTRVDLSSGTGVGPVIADTPASASQDPTDMPQRPRRPS